MKITTTDQPSTTQVSDTDGKDDESINKDEVLEQNIQHIKKMRTSRDQEPTWWILKHNIQQIYHTIIKEWGQQNQEKLHAKNYSSTASTKTTMIKIKTTTTTMIKTIMTQTMTKKKLMKNKTESQQHSPSRILQYDKSHGSMGGGVRRTDDIYTRDIRNTYI